MTHLNNLLRPEMFKTLWPIFLHGTVYLRDPISSFQVKMRHLFGFWEDTMRQGSTSSL